MILLRSLTDLPTDLRGGALSIGNFDGVHLGHAQIISQLVGISRQLDCPAIVLTFDPPPTQILRPESAPPPLTRIEQKAALLGKLGVDVVIAYPTDREILALPPDVFFQSIVQDQLEAKGLVEGPNFCFGQSRAGDVIYLAHLCKQAKIGLEIAQPIERGAKIVSSSRIREHVRQGEVKEAAQLLARPYRIRGRVNWGAQRGAEIGFPTANMEGIDTMLPREGVYAGSARVEEKAWPAAINIGPNPTFGEEALKVEVHLIGFDGDLYQKPLEVDFLQRLRDIHPFDSAEALIAQIKQDVEAVNIIVNK